ncbi:hypothetical protein VaNZ11_016649 [Volvox africanus]|uniref:Uncharacterized protein n=1 Tax=Volvox africanus TaxID=51714 RepID=A0ABQ5SPI5_9CHLO|nr:hypothetical protein VaNZ11_016649 [Volvox africanus]
MYSNGAVPRARKERKVSVVFRHPNDEKHCAGVEAVLCPVVPNHKLLFTASRDSTIKRWDAAGPEAIMEASFDGHADWVNDMAIIGDLLITCSNDQTVRLWKAGSENGQHLHTLSYHSDYVTCLAAAPARSMVVSAGLRAEIFTLNVETGKHTQLYPRSQQSASPNSLSSASSVHAHVSVPSVGVLGSEDGPFTGGSVSNSPFSSSNLAKEQPGSVYALALNPTATVLAAGTSEALVRLLDPRSGKKITKLRGHLDTVRALLLNADGTTLLSGASDGTIKLWDIGMQRCVQTYTLHTDAVWSLLSPDDSFAVIYSAGRDRALYRTYTHTRTSELLAVEEYPVRALALDSDVGLDVAGRSSVGLWAATSASHMNLWVVPRDLPPGSAAGVDTGRAFSVARRSQGLPVNMRNRMSLEQNRQPIARLPEMVIPGTPGLVLHEVLTDKRRVLTQDMRGHVGLWDVLQGAQVASFGKVDFSSKIRELWEPHSVPSWFTADTRLGCLCITLEPTSAFMAEEYGVTLEYGNVSDDFKVNYGKLVLDCAFAKWRYKLAASLSMHLQGVPAGVGLQGTGAPGNLLHSQMQLQGGGLAQPGTLVAAGSGSGSGGLPEGSGAQPYYLDIWPKYWTCRALPAVICSRQDGTRWRRLISSFDGTEVEPAEVPTWVGDVVLRNANVTPKEAKCAFVLLPAEGSNLPSLPQSKLNAPRILQVHKVANYCYGKLQDQGVPLVVRPFYLRRPPYAPESPPESCKGGEPPALELTCNGMAVPYEMSLATIKKYIWKRSDDLIFHFRIRDPEHPAPAPTISGPGG